ncbi:MAG2-interacting protein 2 [Camellia sinensis]|uniref:MAG2-interacting protein 2 n=1 Tax=Camellia sinensis TaxID=4442 RepID=UPI0010362582|nr:MAG2-interacting protein 2 [Camellia sinensis]XP_028099509.1 MAG2-interacting protein 2 [Camellia sinensis]XP_028099510.1 MAG2-interacting protein 2 [Camellia sinensis]
MEEGVREVLYQTRSHASRPFSPNYPPQHQQLNDGVKGSFLSLLSTRGVSQLKEKWSGFRRLKKLKKWITLFVSPSGEHVAVAVGNQITILKKDDDYQEPCGLFTSSSLGSFTSGIWSESHDVLGVVDDTDILYFIKANGEEITRITKKYLKVSLPIAGLIVHDSSDMNKSCLCSFDVLTSDGSLHEVEISQDPSASVFSARTSNNNSTLKEFPENVFCLNYHPETSLLAIVGGAVSAPVTSSCNTGTYSLSLWHRTKNLGLEPGFSTQFEGLYSKPKGYVGQLTYPKVIISPQGKFVATLDLRGCLVIFKLDNERSSLSNLSCGETFDSQVASNMSTRGRESLNNAVDFTWWSDYILVLVKGNGIVTMIDILSGNKLLEKDPLYSMPILERVQQFPGNLFLLESTLSEESHDSSNKKAASDLQHVDLVTEDEYNQLDFAKLRWSLISFSKRSVSEMYDILISDQEYQAALEFANRHRLDKDEVLKSQWLCSARGINEIKMFLSVIKDQAFVLSECVDGVGPTEDAVRASIAHGLHLTNQYRFSETEVDENSQIWEFCLARLKLLQFRDKLETFLGINMGRFSVQEYSKFRIMPINEAAMTLAESGKIGALNLLFKRHPYSLTPFMLEILAAIPETVPVQSYGQLLPGAAPPSSVALREKDWVECQEMVTFIGRLPENQERSIQLRTEPIMKQCVGFSWPSTDELSMWYRNRARDMDSFSGQLGNCLSLVDFACRKGIYELQQFHEDICYLHQLIYSDDSDDEVNFTVGLVAWEQLSDYEKFKMMLKGVKEENMVKRLREKAIPFMQNKFHIMTSVSGDAVMDGHSTAADEKADSFLVKWLKEIASENKLDMCLKVIEDGCRDLQSNSFFRTKVEAADCSLQCIYLCTVADRWTTMASILSKLPEMRDSEVYDEGLKKRLKLAEGHIEAGRLLSFYQVPKPINFFLEAHSDGKGVKQILRLILSKFIRRQPGRSDNDWANMWRDLQSLQEKAFPLVDPEYMLMEFCRGLLKAGKFSLARNYLRGTASVALATDKAENLVIQAAREYFFSASSLACSEIWKAKECVNLFPSSRSVRAEADIMDALTVKLPNLGVTLLPVQFRQIKDPMEIIKLAITSQAGAYLNVDELIETAKLLGLSSQDDIATVEEAIAREAAVAGDLQLAFDLCLVLAKKGHGSVWDLCVAMARGPDLENMDISSRKQLLGFALSYCDDESIGELLHAWKDLDLQAKCETLMMLTGTDPPKFSVHGSSFISFPLQHSQDMADLRDFSQQVHRISCEDQGVQIKNIINILSLVAKDLSKDSGSDWETLLGENSKILSFAALQLPWLLELSCKAEYGKKLIVGSLSGKHYISVRTQAVVAILSWLVRNGFAPRDDLIASLAKSIMEPPVTEEEDIIGSSFLLNLIDAFHGVEIIEEQVRKREAYNEICSIMSVGMIYSLLHNSAVGCENPAQRRELLLRKFQEKHKSLTSDELDKIDRAQSSFWRDWKLKLEEQKRVADHSRVLEQIIPGVETTRFLSGDINYIESVVFSFIESVKLEKKNILKDVLKLASTYGLNCTKVLLQYLSSVLVSEVWTINDVTAEISEFKNEILGSAEEVIKTISMFVYPAIDGHRKQCLAYVYGLLSDCYLQLEGTKALPPTLHPDPAHITISLAQFYKVVEQECNRVSFIKTLNFKNIAGLGGLNFEFFSSEVYAHVDEYCVEALATMVKTLISIYRDPVPECHISWQDVYRHHIHSLLKALETRAKMLTESECPKNLHSLMSELEQIYDVCKKYIRVLNYPDVLDLVKQIFRVIIPLNKSFGDLSSDSTWQDCLVFLLTFWLRVIDDVQEFTSHESPEEKYNLRSLMCCLGAFVRLIVEGRVSPSQGWGTVIGYVSHGLMGGFAVDILNFCRAMVFSGCGFGAIAEVYSEAVSQFQTDSTLISDNETYFEGIQDLPHLYSTILETILQDLAAGSLDRQNLHCLLSSLSRMDSDLEDLKSIRHAVWERMVKFSDDLHLPSHVRVYALELMQFITGSGRHFKRFSAELQSNVLPWDGWDDLRSITAKNETTADHKTPTQTDASNRLTNTLVALKSSQLVRAISLSIEITPEDLLTVDSAVSCFLRLCKDAISEPHFDALLTILHEWEGLYTIGRDKAADSAEESAEAANDWGNDDWDEGWESFQEDHVEKEPEKDDSPSIHPLHACWFEIFKKLVALSRFKDLLKLVDKSIGKSNGILLDQVGAHSLSQIVLRIDCFAALKMALLLPYEAVQVQCLDAVEDKLKQGGVSDAISKDHEFLILVLSSGLISTIISSSSYGTTFSFLCYMVGNFSRQCQEAQLLSIKNKGENEHKNDNKGVSSLFRIILFPCFVSELVKADQQVLAGFLVTKFMHTNASLSLINVAEASLRKYLERQIQVLQDDELMHQDLGFAEPLVNTVTQMRSGLESLIQSALSSLTTNVR